MAILPQADEDGGPAWPEERRDSVAPKRRFELIRLGSTEATRVYWASVGLVVAGLFVTRLLPCVDYPQHIGLSDVARRLFVPTAPEHAEYELNFFTYNGLFHLVVAGLSTIVPIELAGRVVVALSLLGLAGACVALLRTLDRPPEHAALFVPVLFSFSVNWGFVNYALAVTIAAWTLVFVARAARRPTGIDVAAVVGLGLLCAFAHVLAMLVLCLMAATLALEVAWRDARGPTGRRLGRTTVRAAVALAPLLVGCAYCIAVYHRQYAWDPAMYRDPTIEGTAPPLWQKVVMFGAFALDLFGDATDQIILWLTITVFAWAALMRQRDKRLGIAPPDAPIVLPFVAMTIAYFATPMVLIGTHLIFPRLGQWLIFGAVLAMPRFPPRVEGRATRYVLRLAAVAGLNIFLHCGAFGWETADASAVIDDIPAGGAATAVIWDPWTFAFRNGMLTHLAAYYGARKHGQWAFAFARYLSVPVRFKPGEQPPWPRRGWEFNAEAYDPRCRYARAFPFVIIKAPAEVPRDGSGEPIIRKLVFKADAETVRLLSHHGRFWAFDTRGIPEDGSL